MQTINNTQLALGSFVVQHLQLGLYHLVVALVDLLATLALVQL